MAGLYVHIPFCVSKCNYCDFLSFPCRPEETEGYTESLRREMELWQSVMQDTGFDTVYIGGGTPSLLPLGAVSRITDTLRRCFTVASSAEITIEANPDSFCLEKANEYAACGINRVSMGLQSAQGRLLKQLGRPHTAGQYRQAIEYAKTAGIRNISTDVMYGLPGQHLKDYSDTLLAAINAGVVHISAYSLIVEEGTPFFSRKAEGALNLPNEEEEWEMEQVGRMILRQNGFIRYEVSNYAFEGFRCRHNINYWLNGAYLGLGLGAHSRIGNRRFKNERELEPYTDRIKKGELPICGTNNLTQQEDMFETVMMGLRLCAGLDTEAFAIRFGVRLEDAYPKAVEKIVQGGLLRLNAGRAALTARGMDIMNSVLLEFLP
ncbi:MAG: radical SAM family heme chaperone HemW [Christensenellales bacterium]